MEFFVRDINGVFSKKNLRGIMDEQKDKILELLQNDYYGQGEQQEYIDKIDCIWFTNQEKTAIYIWDETGSVAYEVPHIYEDIEKGAETTDLLLLILNNIL